MARTPRPPGRLSENVLAFARALRRAGLPVGPGAAIDAVAALEIAGPGRREDARAALAAVLVKRREHLVLFDQVFDLFWRRRTFEAAMAAAMSPTARAARPPEAPPAGAARAEEALAPRRFEAPSPVETEESSALAASSLETLRRKDFAQMSAAELQEARRLIARLPIASEELESRRWRADARGRSIDPRATLRRQLRSGGRSIDLMRRARRLRRPPLVALCDISGSMSDYSRVILLFLHTLAERRRGTQVFLFGTRLTNVTRAMRGRDADEALLRVGRDAADWSGGTRIAASLRRFNREWSRRVLGQGATVLLFTDGLERDPGCDLEFEMRRLHAACRRLIWLNPLLRYDKFEPKAQGVRTMLPHVDAFLPVHDLVSLRRLCDALAREARSSGFTASRAGAGRLGELESNGPIRLSPR